MFRVIKSGFYATVQDLGRNGFRNKGVPVSGVMDEVAAKELNYLLGNNLNDAMLEITMTGPKLEFTEDTAIALGGANFKVELNGYLIENNKIHQVKKGDVLEYGSLVLGFRGYLAIKNGIKSKKVLNSRSLYFPITASKCLAKGDTFPFKSTTDSTKEKHIVFDTTYIQETTIEVFRGPEFGNLSDRDLGKLFGQDFTISKENNRMAYQLKEVLEEHSISMLTSATLPGTVQLTPAGKLIILMKDGQTTGGYPRILQLSKRSIAIIAQKKTGDSINFNLTS